MLPNYPSTLTPGPPDRASSHPLVGAALALGLGLGIGWLDLQTTEVTTTIVALLLAGMLLGLLRPAGAWRWAALLASGLPVAATAGHLLDARTAEPIQFDPRVWLVALAFALVACYAGVAIRWVAGLLSDA